MLSLILTILCLAVPVLLVLWTFPGEVLQRRAGERYAFLLLALLAAFGLFRPHEHVFQGLDCSALRLMAQSLSEGRPLQGQDQVLQELDPELRPWVLLTPGVHRITRDRSWQLANLKENRDFPFFYPLLPIIAAGWETLIPGSLDYFVPLTGWLFLLALFTVLSRRYGPAAALWGLLVFLACYLPIWMWRGFYLEAPGLALLGAALLISVERSRLTSAMAFLLALACGLAVSFHPSLVLFSLPLAAWILWQAQGLGATVAAACGCILGITPIVYFSYFLTSPYGPMFFHLFSRFEHPVLARSLLLTSLFVLTLLYVAIAVRRPHIPKGAARLSAMGLGLLVLLLWGGMCMHPATRGYLEYGLRDLHNGLRWPLLIMLALTLIWGLVRFNHLPALRLILVVVLLVLPAFLVLKGSDRMPVWSMRRLLPPLFFVLLASSFAGPELYRLLATGRMGRYVKIPAAGLALAACLYVPVRWTAPYSLRYDVGADAQVAEVRSVMANRWTLFDEYPLAVPFTVFPGNRTLAISMETPEKLPLLTSWFTGHPALGERLIATAYDSPGLLQQSALSLVWQGTLNLDRIHTPRAALPAKAAIRTYDLSLYQIIPLAPGDFRELDRTFPQNWFGLEGPWGRANVGIKQGPGKPRLPARWSREGSRFMGPVPAPGMRVRLTVYAAAERSDRPDQTLYITPPWSETSLELTFGKNMELQSLLLPAVPDAEPQPATGWYTLTSAHPFDPGALAIRGFHNDLGVLLHRVVFEELRE